MDTLTKAEQLFHIGRYRESLEALEHTVQRDSRLHELLRAELLEVLGRTGDARSAIGSFLSGRGLPDIERGRAEFVVSRLDAEVGNLESELRHLQKSIFHSERAKDLRTVCTSQLRLLALLADRSGHDSARGIMRSVRTNVIRLGDPRVTASLHLFISEIDGKRGLLKSAIDHTKISIHLLQSHPHLWLEAWAHNNLLALSILQSDFDAAFEHGRKALSLSTACGASASIRRCLGNLGRLHFSRGNFEAALEHLNQALLLCSSSPNEHVNGTLESIARVYLAQNRAAEGLDLIYRIEAETQPPNATGRYVHRHSLLTKAELLLCIGRTSESLDCLHTVQELAKQSEDMPLLATVAHLTREATSIIGSESDIVTTPLCHLGSMELYGMYERTIGTVLVRRGKSKAAAPHFDRAGRILNASQNIPAMIELRRAQERTTIESRTTSISHLSEGFTIQGIAAALTHASNAEFLATELLAILEHVGCLTSGMAIARSGDGVEAVLGTFGDTAPGPHVRTLAVGTSRQRAIELRLTPRADVESQATLNSVGLLLATAAELESARAEREQRLTLWPLEQLPIGHDDSVIMGEMEKLMAQARRIAQTHVVVLITGESGTGKEVLARAIHGYSARARKPFVPFNCTAIARDLLESQLFGHRRGAFTGADRDMLGLVRSAKDGTLFLDEVGEMALDLQPKLLRFLESGEINPLGESSPFTVDVRIIAATNADLDRLVEQGRFREDLFYRLNVVRLTVPPLRERRDEIPALVHHFVAKACIEFGKERVKVAEETMEQLLLYSWPGNVRQLQNELRRIVALADNDTVLTPATLSKAIRQETMHAGKGPVGPDFSVTLADKLEPTISRIEREMIKAALTANQGKLEAAARALGISRKGLYLKRQRLGV